MAGAGLIAIRRRVKSVVNTRKITKAMGLVATSKLRKVREKLEINDQYYESFYKVILEIVENQEDRNIYVQGNGSKKRLYIVLTSDKGLCGGFNGAVIGKTLEELRKDRENSQIMMVGQKGRTYFNRIKQDTVAEYVEIPDIPSLKEAQMIGRHAIDMYLKKEVGEINVVYTQFYSTVKQVPTVVKLLPLEAQSGSFDKGLTLFEPNPDSLLDAISTTYVSQAILHFMLHSKASEQGTRMSAMDGATKNADDLIEKLNLKYNRVRQGAITQEISEIVGGAEAQR